MDKNAIFTCNGYTGTIFNWDSGIIMDFYIIGGYFKGTGLNWTGIKMVSSNGSTVYAYKGHFRDMTFEGAKVGIDLSTTNGDGGRC